ncbi:MAG: hypothetical protein IPK29_15135 [Betaproteobacteria bacterium]|nr:hypothetical protein [Betaproteobacteria bacterium]
MLAVELFHEQGGAPAAPDQRAQQLVLQSMVLGVVVDLAENRQVGLGERRDQNLRGDRTLRGGVSIGPPASAASPQAMTRAKTANRGMVLTSRRCRAGG